MVSTPDRVLTSNTFDPFDFINEFETLQSRKVDILAKSMEIAKISGTDILAAAMESSGIPTELEYS